MPLTVWRNRKAYVDFLHDGTLASDSELRWYPDGGADVQIGTFDGTDENLETFNYSSWAASGELRVQEVTPVVVYATLEVILKEECANPIHIAWINDLGGMSQWLFDGDQVLSIQPSEDGQFRIYTVVARNLTDSNWDLLQSLNKTGPEFGDNEKMGAFVQDITDVSNPINIYVIPQTSQTRTKKVKNEFIIDLRYPILENIGI